METPVEIEIAMLEEAHTMSLSKDKRIASRGRFLKAVGVPCIAWMRGESDRGEKFDDIGVALVMMLSSMLVHYAVTYLDPGAHAEFLEVTTEHLGTIAKDHAAYVNDTRIKLQQQRTGNA